MENFKNIFFLASEGWEIVPSMKQKIKHHKKGALGEKMRGTAFGLEVMKPVESMCTEYLVTANAGNHLLNGCSRLRRHRNACLFSRFQ